MSTRTPHLVMIWLAAIGLLVQGLSAGMPGGMRLCLGCPDGGWSVSHVGAPETACCDHADEAHDGAPAAGAPDLHEDDTNLCGDECGCIRIPMIPRADVTLTPARIASHAGADQSLTTLVAIPVAIAHVPERPDRSARFAVGPPEPLRPLSARARRTVLLL